MSIFPIITEERQSMYEDFAFWNKNAKYKNDIPCICGVYGRACRSMNEKANSMLCTDCPLSNFVGTMESIVMYCNTNTRNLENLNPEDIREIGMMPMVKFITDKENFITNVRDYLIQTNSYQNFYFTFGSDQGFPYQRGYLIVQALNMPDAIRKFRNRYPDRTENCLNCAFVYTQEQWDKSETDMGTCHRLIK